MANTELGEEVLEQIKQQGVAAFRTNDSEVFVFTTATLERLLEASREEGRVMVIVRSRPTA